MREIIENWQPFPRDEGEKNVLIKLAETATFTAVDRHAGEIKYLYGPTGRQKIVKGKDLTNIKYIVGTGGALGREEPGRLVLSKMLKRYQPSKLTPPKDAEIILDLNYTLAAVGLLSVQAPEIADKILTNFLEQAKISV